MGKIYAELILANPAKENLHSITANALIDTGALILCIPEHIALQLQLTEYEKREVTIADGSKKLVPYVGPVKINYLNRMCLTGALVLGTNPSNHSLFWQDIFYDPLEHILDKGFGGKIKNPTFGFCLLPLWFWLCQVREYGVVWSHPHHLL